jgi:ectoine hydroxylase-related dioxygenase (phytanoyl-CoA dioxygenase family)
MSTDLDIVRQADKLASQGSFLPAIRLLEEREHYDDPLLAQRLIDLRVRAFDELEWPAPAIDWPPQHDNRYAGIDGFPEVDAADLDVESLKAGILGRGGLIVRGLMDEQTRETMRANIDRTLQARMDAAENESMESVSPWYYRCDSVKGGPAQFRGGQRYTNIGSVWSVDSPPTAFQLVRFFRRVGIPELLRGYFQEDPVLSVRKWVVRCAAPNNGASSGWHQDGRFLGDPSIRSANLWITLTDCGGDADAPGLELLPGHERKIFETGTRGAPFDWTVGPELVEELAQTTPVHCPRFNAGDAIFFDHYNLHRTGFGVDHTQNRYALESWFFAASHAPRKQQPIVL